MWRSSVSACCFGSSTSWSATLLSLPFALIAANLAAWVGFRYRTRVAATDGDGKRPGKRLLLLGAFLCLSGLVSAKWAWADKPVDIISGVLAVMFLVNGIVLIVYSFRTRA